MRVVFRHCRYASSRYNKFVHGSLVENEHVGTLKHTSLANAEKPNREFNPEIINAEMWL